MKDNPFMWQPVTDFIFHIDAKKKNGFEKRILISVCIVAFISIFCVGLSHAEIYHDQRPEYADSDFMKPEAMIMLEQLELFQIIVIAAMLAVIALKVFGTYLMLRYSDPTIKFNPAFIVSGILGVFIGYTAYMGSNPATDTTYINIFMCAGYYAIGADLLVNFASKIRGKLS